MTQTPKGAGEQSITISRGAWIGATTLALAIILAVFAGAGWIVSRIDRLETTIDTLDSRLNARIDTRQPPRHVRDQNRPHGRPARPAGAGARRSAERPGCRHQSGQVAGYDHDRDGNHTGRSLREPCGPANRPEGRPEPDAETQRDNDKSSLTECLAPGPISVGAAISLSIGSRQMTLCGGAMTSTICSYLQNVQPSVLREKSDMYGGSNVEKGDRAAGCYVTAAPPS